MGFLEKLKILGAAAKYDLCASTASNRANSYSKFNKAGMGNPVASGVCHSFTPDGRCVSLFRVLLTNQCSNDCAYCINRVGRECLKASFEPKELVRVFLGLYERNYVEGLFLSSGMPRDPEIAMEKTLEVVELLRTKHYFNGYIHLKLIPGANYDQIKRASAITDRLSMNIEAPSQSRLSELSSTKRMMTDILKRMKWIKTLAEREDKYVPAGQTTQFVVGAAGESDLEILERMEKLYCQMDLKRAYFSAFDPIGQTPLEKNPKTPVIREVRLCQADFLYRHYDFHFRDLKNVLNENNMFNLSKDVKLCYAFQNLDRYPIDVNNEDITLKELLKVPGIGPTSARRIIKAKKAGYRFKKLKELARIGVVIKRATPFLEINGQKQTRIDNYV
ncbi:putative DNA modification/repair radical SAM protein [Candidatus Borrarchaeum sp.]|uniref:putative DNA modification/repair radical SAM protein n=1 Tax=Candidatus Borrarchaeum sp. TaxID=2846742 RepID=UPI00257AD66A|nr:putative DNA modification/repair radical SAM protein [Candidatus Borrarchaeum sp.]